MLIENKITSKSGAALLFDMDGTLTEARKKIQKPTVKMLRNLCESGHIVCIVSGSPFVYINEQLDLALSDYAESLYVMPCNGTQVYTQNNLNGKYDQTYKVTMRDYLEQHSTLADPHRELVHNILELQLYSMRRYDFPVTGNFISDRGSMINWCPIGRDASHEVRATFSIEDSNKSLRKHLRDCLRVRLDDSDLRTTDLALGGSTSIDIFPNGWDKTYALNHLDPSLDVWFWGDKCMPGGNDYTIYEKLGTDRAFAVDSPEDVLSSIEALRTAGKI